MKEHLPRVYWRDLPPEATGLLSAGSGAAPGEDWTEFRPLADAMLKDFSFHAHPAGPEHDGPVTGYCAGPTSQILRALQPPRALTISELNEPIVGRLQATNPYSEKSVLIPGGTILLGGAQNRVVRQPILIPPGIHELPVFCVEMGRWEMERQRFDGLTRLPGLLAHKIGSIQAEDLMDRQSAVWDYIYESLSLLGQLNPTLNVNGWQSPGDAAAGAPSVAGPAGGGPETDPDPGENWRGLYSIDPATGLSTLHLAPHQEFGGLSEKGFERDLAWRRTLRGNAQGAREFFRLFDENKRLAIRCLPDGRALRDMRKRPILFEYKDPDLEHSFRPPIEKPPEPPPLSFAGVEDHFARPEDFLERIRESRARLTRRVQDGLFDLELRHPELPLHGNGLVYRNELASLDVSSFRPFAKT